MPIHIKAESSDLADSVLLPGNPERAEYIAEEFLDEPELYNDYRKLLGYTGFFDGTKVSVQTTGMGVPSANIIMEELNMLRVSRVVRVGTCGALSEGLNLADLVLPQSAATIGTGINKIGEKAILSPASNFSLMRKLWKSAEKNSIPIHVGQVVTSDYFYEVDSEIIKKLANHGVLAAEMETAGIFNKASKFGIEAASVLTVSDLFFEEERASRKKIVEGVDRMTKIVLESLTEDS
ncbi:MAG: purine-nucleoside phosphorylase [Candidatus Bipolaricaulota bacterium]|nr:purine-nucleoside phosphorylase [Candidatus Bipolaricaulota bacterium]